jgi:hypothetical protein
MSFCEKENNSFRIISPVEIVWQKDSLQILYQPRLPVDFKEIGLMKATAQAVVGLYEVNQ